MLRPELEPPDLDTGPLTAQLERAYDRIGAGEPAETVASDFQRESGVAMDGSDLLGWYGSTDPEELAAILLLPPRHELARHALTREELIEVARRLLFDSDDYDEEHEAWWTALFDANVPHPAGHQACEDDDPTPEQLTDAALAYRPIEL